MRTITLLAALVCSILYSTGDTCARPPLINGCSSAANINQPVLFNCDFSGMIGSGIDLHYKEQGAGSFTLLPMSLVNESPYYDSTYQAAVDGIANSGITEFYFSSTQDTLIATQSPKNANNQFPPSAYNFANFISDAQGDMAGGSAGNWLDLTDNGMSYSDTRLYCYLRNLSGTWPLNSGFTYFAYTCGFLIASDTDTSYYALVYANIPLLISTGLYILDRIDSTYTRLGNISSTISGGALYMACDFSTFAADPAWPGWPPPSGFIIPMGATLTASLTDQFVNDITYPAIYEPQTQYLNIGTTTAPELSSFHLESDSGVSITPRVDYFDRENNIPVTRIFHFDSDLFILESADHSYSDSSEFFTTLGWPGDGWHRYYCEFSDGVDTITSSLDSLRIGVSVCNYLVGDVNNNSAFNGIDVSYSVGYFKGGPVPPYTCDCNGSSWYIAGDVNGNCAFNGIDVSYMVTYFKGGPNPVPCPACQ